MKKNYILLLAAFIGCINFTAQAQYGSGVFVLNEGNFGTSNASVSFLEDGGTLSNNIFSTVNPSETLGQTLQSIGFKDNEAYIVSNGSSEISVVDRVTFSYVSTIQGLENPRYMAFDNGYGYVTNWGDPTNANDDYVAVVRLYDNTVVNTIPVVEGPEEIVKKNNQMFVAQQGGYGTGNTVSVIDLADYTVTSILLSDLPNSIEVDDDYLYVLCGGKPAWTSDETQAVLYRISLNDFSQIENFNFASGEHPDFLEVKNGEAYYVLNNNVYHFDFSTASLPTTPFIDTSAEGVAIFYGFSFIDDVFYIADAVDYVADGKLFTYDASGTYLNTYTVGKLPNGVYKYVEETVEGIYAGAAGQEGSEAIPYDSSLFVDWASGIELTRGYVNISDPAYQHNGSVYATYGVADAAIGAPDNSVVSLGDAGEAILTFTTPITDGDGYDFAVFENAFSDTFLELAFVEVSSDGINYFRFPAHSLTQTATQVGGFGSVDPTYIHNLAGKYKAFYGTPFDLSDLEDDPLLDKNNITHVKIIDVVGSIDPDYASYDAYANAINDPFPTPFYSAGFDLDAVGVINQKQLGVTNNTLAQLSLYPNPATHYFKVKGFSENIDVEIYSQTGQLVSALKNVSQQMVDVSQLNSGLYMVRVSSDQKNALFRLVKN